MSEADIKIDWLGGNCPVQAEGAINGVPFYFRARGDRWSLGIGAEPVGNPDWQHEEWFGEWPDAGWMTEVEAEGFLRQAAALYAEGKPGKKFADDPDRLRARQNRQLAADTEPPTGSE
jgi:hypothetical protein